VNVQSISKKLPFILFCNIVVALAIIREPNFNLEVKFPADPSEFILPLALNLNFLPAIN
jgi:hypothetical protein